MLPEQNSRKGLGLTCSDGHRLWHDAWRHTIATLAVKGERSMISNEWKKRAEGGRLTVCQVVRPPVRGVRR